MTIGMTISPITHIDVSKWIPGINWACIKEQGLEWCATRATVSNYYVDPLMLQYLDGMKDVGILRTPYHVTRADRMIGNTDNSPEKQMDFFSRTIEGHHDGVVILDVELANVYGSTTDILSKQQITDVNMRCLEIAESRYKVIFYTRASFMNAYMSPDPRFSKLNLFLAEYGKDDGLWYGCHLLPNGCTMEQVVLHQFSGKGKPLCCDPIVNAMDYDIVINKNLYKDIYNITDQTDDSLDDLRNTIKILEERLDAIENRLDNATIKI